MKQFNVPGSINESVKSKTLQQLINTKDKWAGNKQFVSWLDANNYRLSEISDSNFVEVAKTTDDIKKSYSDKKNIIAINQQSGEVVLFIYNDQFIVNVFDKKRIAPLVNSLSNWPDTKVYKLVNIGAVKKVAGATTFNEKLFFEEATKARLTLSKGLVMARELVNTVQSTIVGDDAKRTLESPAFQNALFSIAVKYGTKDVDFIKNGTFEVRKLSGYAEQYALAIKYKYKGTYGDEYTGAATLCSAYTADGRKSYGSKETNVLGDVMMSFLDSWKLSFDSVVLKKYVYNSERDKNSEQISFENDILKTDPVITKACMLPEAFDKWSAKNNVPIVPIAAATKPKNKWSTTQELVGFIENYGNIVTEFNNYDCFVLFNPKFGDTVYVATTDARAKNIREKYPLSSNTIVLAAITGERYDKTIDLSKIPGSYILGADVITSFNPKGSKHTTRFITFSDWVSRNADSSFGSHKIVTSTNTVVEQEKWATFFAKSIVKIYADANVKFPNAGVQYVKGDDRYVGSFVYNAIKAVFADNYKLANAAQAIADQEMQKLIK